MDESEYHYLYDSMLEGYLSDQETEEETEETPSLAGEYPNLAPLFESNDVPKPAQVGFIKEILRDRNATLFTVDTKLCEIRAEFSRMQSIIKSLLQQQRALYSQERGLRDELHQCQGVIAAVRRLPPEIIGEIFLYFAPVLVDDHRFEHCDYGERYFHHDLRYMRTKTPWHLGHICSYWRTVALSIRPLWSVLDLRTTIAGPIRSWFINLDDVWSMSPPSHNFAHCRIYPTTYASDGTPIFRGLEERAEDEEEEFWAGIDGAAPPEPEIIDDFIQIASCIEPSLNSVENCLLRSGNAPISARVVFHDAPHSIPFSNALLRCAHRLSDLRFVDVPQAVLDEFSESCSQSKQLRSLAFLSTAVFSPQPIFDYPSSLVNLDLTCISLPAATRISIPWAQLLKYCEHNCEWDSEDDRWTSYRQLSDVNELCVQFSKTARSSQSPALLPKLQHAWLICRGEQQKGILHSFDTPILQSLSYDHRDCSYPEVRLRYTLPHLKSLRYRVMTSRPLDIFSGMLGKCPNLTEIFANWEHTPAFEPHPTASLMPEDWRLPGPKLEVARLKLNFDINKDYYDQIHEMFQSRLVSDSKSVPRLRKFTLFDSSSLSYYDPEGYRRIQNAWSDLKDQGLTLSIGSSEQGDLDFFDGWGGD
ncbi:hypothetical protein K438DRAFT_1964010 [Mycena galopus ATCC 62051]|nr:hypothetical protein K438DRAFT_1964010 [Mycena galopus ATCC 62051]